MLLLSPDVKVKSIKTNIFMENKNLIIKKEYRAEIDGLRALAVFFVIINHCNIS